MLRKSIHIFRPVLTRLKGTCPTPKQPTYILECLKERELVRVSGTDAVPFLQGLITNDMNHFVSSQLSSMYTMVLNKAGRLLFDTIIYRTQQEGNIYLLECDKRISADLKRHLRVYRVRRKVEIDSIENVLTPWVVFRPDDGQPKIQVKNPDVLTSPDPRVKSLGIRMLVSPDKNWNQVAQMFCNPQEMNLEVAKCEYNYRVHLYKNGVGEGVIDHPPGKSFPLEANGDFLHGISFNKGCYVGQELTARVYHTGMVRKRLLPLRITAKIPDSNTTVVQTLAGAKIGVIRGISYDRCLALLRLEQAFNTNTFMIDGDACYLSKPDWWPKELPKKSCIREN